MDARAQVRQAEFEDLPFGGVAGEWAAPAAQETPPLPGPSIGEIIAAGGPVDWQAEHEAQAPPEATP
jgi:hypothetical protein